MPRTSTDWIEAARQMIRYALEQEQCAWKLHQIVDEERERLWETSPVWHSRRRAA